MWGGREGGRRMMEVCVGWAHYMAHSLQVAG